RAEMLDRRGAWRLLSDVRAARPYLEQLCRVGRAHRAYGILVEAARLPHRHETAERLYRRGQNEGAAVTGDHDIVRPDVAHDIRRQIEIGKRKAVAFGVDHGLADRRRVR